MLRTVENIRKILYDSIDSSPGAVGVFFKTGPGEYAEFDQFLGIKTPTLRRIAKKRLNLLLAMIGKFLQSKFNEERLFALVILVMQYKKADFSRKNDSYQFYLNNMEYVNNWNLVDNSAHHILGAHLWDKDRGILIELAKSENLLERRISIVATLYFIKRRDFESTIEVVKMVLEDGHDLIHKASGWVLREIGKLSPAILIDFLERHCVRMPRTMLRYARLEILQNTSFKSASFCRVKASERRRPSVVE